MSKSVSPLAPKSFPTLPAIDGVRIATAEAGIRYKNRTDVLYVTLPKDTAVAGVFTRSKCPSAPVDWCRKNLAKGTARALVVNSGNANAFTGKKGAEAVKLTADIAAEAAGCRASQVFIASTGVIGEPLDATKFGNVLACLREEGKAHRLARCRQGDHDHRHLPESGDAHGDHRRRRGDDQRHRQGRGHDRARHGDHALLRLHGCAHRGPGAADAC